MTHAEKIENSKVVDKTRLKFKEAKVITPKKRLINILITVFLSLFTIYNYFLKKKTYLIFEFAKISSEEVMLFLYLIIILILVTNIILTFVSKSILAKNHPRRYKTLLYFNKANKLIIASLNLVNALIIVMIDLQSSGEYTGNLTYIADLKAVFNTMTSNFEYLKDFSLFMVALIIFIPYFFVSFAIFYALPVLIFISPILYLRWLFTANDIFYNYVSDPNEEGYIIKEKRRINIKFYKFSVIFRKIFFTILIAIIIVGIAFIIQNYFVQQ